MNNFFGGFLKNFLCCKQIYMIFYFFGEDKFSILFCWGEKINEKN